ncbi:MAG: MBL fold metallo-hydrolase [bacterium]
MNHSHIKAEFHYFGGPFFSFYIADTGSQVLMELGISQIVPHLKKTVERTLGRFDPGWLTGMHSHYDHVGGAPRLKGMFPAARLAGSAATDTALRDESLAPVYARTMESLNDNPLFSRVYPDADGEVVFRASGMDVILKEGDAVPLGGGDSLLVLETPGHSACSISLFHEATRTLFASDACGVPLPSGRIWITGFQSLALFGQSLQRFLSLEPEALCPGHVPPFRGKSAVRYLERALKVTDSFRNHVAELVGKHRGADAAVDALMKEYEDDLPFLQPGIFRYGCLEMVRQFARD